MRRLFLAAVLCLTAVPATAVELGGLQKVSDVQLKDIFAEYYEAEAADEWEKTYSFRGHSFQEIVPYELYARNMSDDAAGWQTNHVEITDVRTLPSGNVIITARFTEKILSAEVSEEMGFGGRSVITSTVQETVWGKQRGRWICLEAGDRLHLPLNRRIGD